jgi:hypothetical protein
MIMVRLCAALFLAVALCAASPAALALTAAEVFDKAHHALYMVIVTSDEPGVVDVVAQGSAVLIAPGRFVTNCHVIERGKHFVISRREDKVIERVFLVNYERGKDLCELDLATPKPGFDKPVEIAPSNTLQVGQTVYAIGSPRGMEMTISNGIISGFRDANGGMKLIQTTAALSRGSSGGGLFDDQGRLVGITTLVAKNAQNLNFAVPAQYIPSAGISLAALMRQRTGSVRKDDFATQEIAIERQERLRRQEQDKIAARMKELESPIAPVQEQDKVSAPILPSVPRPAAARKPISARLAPSESTVDAKLPARVYAQMVKNGQLAGLDDDAAIRKVYEALIGQHIASQLRWREGGDYVAEFRVQLRRSGEVMFVIPVRPSGVERFDEEAQRAIGAASPLPVPQDNEVFDQMNEITIAVKSPARPAAATPGARAKKAK